MTLRTAALALTAALLLAGTAQADEALLQAKCGACHTQTDTGLSRISGQRKTPEGWLMTIVRMRALHGLDISPADQAALVAYLSDTRGLAPTEAAAFRYGPEKDPAIVEPMTDLLSEMCARCHTLARVALQRRSAAEWAPLIDFHVGAYPTIEYQDRGRDREWFRIARDEIVPYLAEHYPLNSDAWTDWQAAPKPQVTGDWVVLADLPSGAAWGRMTVTGDAPPYAITGEMTLPDGSTAPLSGRMNLYTGYEWRANVSLGGTAYRQVLAVSEDGAALTGRQFLAETDSLGGRLSAAKTGSGTTLLGLVPEAAAPGTVTVQAVGTGLDGLTGGTATPNPSGATVTLDGTAGQTVTLTAGSQSATVSFYDRVDRLTVEPAFTIARVGGGSDAGPPPVPVQFSAIGWWNGPDGQPGTADDIRIGAIPADWSVTDHSRIAQRMQDSKFAGEIGADGIFTPAQAGPNPQRRHSANNTGDLRVIAQAGGQTGTARLLVTVQRFIDPPLR